MPPVISAYGRTDAKSDRVTHRRLQQVSRTLRCHVLSGRHSRRRNRLDTTGTSQDISSDESDEYSTVTSTTDNDDNEDNDSTSTVSCSTATGATFLSSAEAKRLFRDLQKHHQWRKHREVLADALRLASRRKVLRRRVPPPTPTCTDSVSTVSTVSTVSSTVSSTASNSTTASDMAPEEATSASSHNRQKVTRQGRTVDDAKAAVQLPIEQTQMEPQQQWKPCPRKLRMAQREFEMDSGYFSLTLCLSQEEEEEEQQRVRQGQTSGSSGSLKAATGQTPQLRVHQKFHRVLRYEQQKPHHQRALDSREVGEESSTITRPGVELSRDSSSAEMTQAAVKADDALETDDAAKADADAEDTKEAEKPSPEEQQQQQRQEKRQSLEPGLIGGLHQQLTTSWCEAVAASQTSYEDENKSMAWDEPETDKRCSLADSRVEETPEKSLQEDLRLREFIQGGSDKGDSHYVTDSDESKSQQAAETKPAEQQQRPTDTAAAGAAEMAKMLPEPALLPLPIASCPATILGHLSRHEEQLELIKRLLSQQMPDHRASSSWPSKAQLRASLNLLKPLRLSEGSRRRCSTAIELPLGQLEAGFAAEMPAENAQVSTSLFALPGPLSKMAPAAQAEAAEDAKTG